MTIILIDVCDEDNNFFFHKVPVQLFEFKDLVRQKYFRFRY